MQIPAFTPLVLAEIGKFVVLWIAAVFLFRRYNQTKSWITLIWSILLFIGGLGESIDGLLLDLTIEGIPLIETLNNPLFQWVIERLRVLILFAALSIFFYASLRLQFGSHKLVTILPLLVIGFMFVIIGSDIPTIRTLSLGPMLLIFSISIISFLRIYFIGVKIVNPLIIAFGLIIIILGQTLKIISPDVLIVVFSEIVDLIGYIVLTIGILKPLPE